MCITKHPSNDKSALLFCIYFRSKQGNIFFERPIKITLCCRSLTKKSYEPLITDCLKNPLNYYLIVIAHP